MSRLRKKEDISFWCSLLCFSPHSNLLRPAPAARVVRDPERRLCPPSAPRVPDPSPRPSQPATIHLRAPPQNNSSFALNNRFVQNLPSLEVGAHMLAQPLPR